MTFPLDNMTSTPHRTYERTWAEIEEMLERATEKMHQWKEWYGMCTVSYTHLTLPTKDSV